MSTAPSTVEAPAASFASVAEMWNHRVNSTPDADAHYYKQDGAWQTQSWRQADQRVRKLGNALLAFGLAEEQRCALLASTSVEWILADLGILNAGGATTTVYPSNTSEECAYILNDCGAVLVFAENDEQVAKLLQARAELPTVKQVVVFDGQPSEDGWVVTLDAFEAEGAAHAEAHPDAYDARWKAITPERLATLIYTSGTTGKPKGVMLTHASWVYEADAIDRMGIITPADRQFLFLPLSHVFAKVMQIIYIRIGVPTSVDGSIPDLIDHLGEQAPTWMGAVPRVFEKAYNKIVSNAKDAGGLKYAIFKWAVGVGTQVSQLRQQGKEPGGLLKLQYGAAEALVFNKVKDVFGGRLRFLISGGAPLAKEIAEFFHACGILILEGYGMTESTAASTVNHPDHFVFGSVGEPIPGTEIRIADDGEILIRGPGVMKGYYGLDDVTAETIVDGWLHTGDIGTVLPSGHVKITDRKKEIIITAGGKNIAPAHFQNKLKVVSPYVSQVLMHGDKRNFCVALITINEETVGKWAADQGLSFTDYADLSAKPEVHALIEQAVAEVNADLPSYETVKTFHLCPEDWTVDNGALTPSMKVKRRVVEDRYREVLDGFYADTVKAM